ncbi:MAG: hypothetical protein JXR63_03155 [Spirochaetales bacterium]|nr:hypothetical protein [Spirochaetales bacterium]
MKLKSFSLLFFLFFSFSTFAQKPLWISYQEGIEFFKDKRFSEAMAIFKKCTLENPTYPEAEYWIGRIFEIEGELELAKRQYLKALDPTFINALNIPDFEFTIRTALAGIYQKTGYPELYIEQINAIIHQDPWFLSDIGKQNLSAIYNLWLDKGINRVFELFRVRNRRFASYYSMAGIYYYNNGKVEDGVKMLSISVLSALSELAEIQKNMHPDFIFTTRTNFEKRYLDAAIPKELYDFHLDDIVELIDLSLNDPRIEQYLVEADFFKNIYYLGMAFAAGGHNEHAFDMLIICSSYQNAGYFQDLALKKMQSLLIIN